jgi:hypothetical protein
VGGIWACGNRLRSRLVLCSSIPHPFSARPDRGRAAAPVAPVGTLQPVGAHQPLDAFAATPDPGGQPQLGVYPRRAVSLSIAVRACWCVFVFFSTRSPSGPTETKTPGIPRAHRSRAVPDGSAARRQRIVHRRRPRPRARARHTKRHLCCLQQPDEPGRQPPSTRASPASRRQHRHP